MVLSASASVSERRRTASPCVGFAQSPCSYLLKRPCYHDVTLGRDLNDFPLSHSLASIHVHIVFPLILSFPRPETLTLLAFMCSRVSGHLLYLILLLMNDFLLSVKPSSLLFLWHLYWVALPCHSEVPCHSSIQYHSAVL